MCPIVTVTSTVPGTLLALSKHLLNNEANAVGLKGSVLSGCPRGLMEHLVGIDVKSLPSWLEESATAGDLGPGHALL